MTTHPFDEVYLKNTCGVCGGLLSEHPAVKLVLQAEAERDGAARHAEDLQNALSAAEAELDDVRALLRELANCFCNPDATPREEWAALLARLVKYRSP